MSGGVGFQQIQLVDVNGNPLTGVLINKAPEKFPYWDANGDQQLADYIRNKAFNMGITAATPGDLSVNIATNTCRYDKIGDFVDVSILLVFTPTYTTATGNIILTGLPFMADSDSASNFISMVATSAFTWPNTATTMGLTPSAGTTQGIILGLKTGSSGAGTQITAFTSGTAATLRFRGRYRTTRV